MSIRIGDRDALRPQPAGHREAVHPGHGHVEHDRVRRRSPRPAASADAAVGDRDDGVALGGERALEHPPDRGVVVDDEDARKPRVCHSATIGGDGESHVRERPGSHHRRPRTPPPYFGYGERRIGRAAFLSVVGLGGLGLLAGDRISSILSGPLGAAGSVVPQGLKDILPIGGWRIYAINPPWPEFHPAQYRLEVTGHVRKPLSCAGTT